MSSFPSFKQLAIPFGCTVFSFLAFSSQYLFQHIEPGPLNKSQTIWVNVLIVCVSLSYYKVCSVHPGDLKSLSSRKDDQDDNSLAANGNVRWCKICDAVKPPRAHHCKQCKRCIPKMDHHCPWLANCVSQTTFPHFIRFVLYSVVGLSVMQYLVLARCWVVYTNRNLPSYLGPSIAALSHLLVLLLINSIALFALSILLFTSLKSLATNTTTIESWEIERHEVLAERAKRNGGCVNGPGGVRVRIRRQEFPYDIGIWKNICQGMGSDIAPLWFWPLASGPKVQDAMKWETNGFEDDATTWPPPDPDRRAFRYRPNSEGQYRPMGTSATLSGFVVGSNDDTFGDNSVAAFKRRQNADSLRRQAPQNAAKQGVARDEAEVNRPDDDDDDDEEDEYESEFEEGLDGEAGWTNSDGDRLRDYGVDEDDDDDIPLGELLLRRQAAIVERK